MYRVTRRVELGIKATAVCSEKLQHLLKDISRVWNNLMGFMSLAKLAVRCFSSYKLSKTQLTALCTKYNAFSVIIQAGIALKHSNIIKHCRSVQMTFSDVSEISINIHFMIIKSILH